jgi:molybdenum cofactor biosynthesis enzyme MoaA
MSVDLFARLIAVFAHHGVRSVKLTGGEPTTRSDLPAFVELAHASGQRVSVITNGIRMPQAVLRALGPADEVKFSIHRPDSNNDEVLGLRSFDRVVTNVETTRLSGVRTAINCVVEPGRTGDVHLMIEFARSLGVEKISFMPVVPRGDAAGAEADGCRGPDDVARLHAKLAAWIPRRRGFPEVRVIDFRTKPYWIVENDGALWRESWADELDECAIASGTMSELLAEGTSNG